MLVEPLSQVYLLACLICLSLSLSFYLFLSPVSLPLSIFYICRSTYHVMKMFKSIAMESNGVGLNLGSFSNYLCDMYW